MSRQISIREPNDTLVASTMRYGACDRMVRALLGGMLAIMLVVGLMSGSTLAQSQNGQDDTLPAATAGFVSTVAKAELNNFPPIDIFVYADQSVSLFRGTVGERPGDKLIELIRTSLERELGDAGSRRVFSGNGQLFMYGFGGQPRTNVPDRDGCSAQVRTLIPGAEVSQTDVIDQGFTAYRDTTSQGPERFTRTDFTCLYDHIAGNEDVSDSTRRNRQAIVLLASDFVHDPYDMSSITGQVANANRTIGQAGRGVCDLYNNFYKTKKIPPEIRDGIKQVRDVLVREGRFPPITLMLNYPLQPGDVSRADFPNSNGFCTLETSRNRTVLRRMTSAWSAEGRDFLRGTQSGMLARLLTDNLQVRIAPKVVINNLVVAGIDDDTVELKAVVNNPTKYPAQIVSISAWAEDGRWIKAADVDRTVGPGVSIDIGPVSASWSGSDDSQDYRLEYVLQGAGKRRISSESVTARKKAGGGLSVTVEEPFFLPSGRMQATLNIRSGLDRNVRVTSVVLTSNGARQNLNTERLSNQLFNRETTQPVSFTFDIPDDVQAALSPVDENSQGARPRVTIAVRAVTEDGENAVSSPQVQIQPTTENRQPFQVVEFKARFSSLQDASAADISLRISNPNRFSGRIDRCEVRVNEGRPFSIMPLVAEQINGNDTFVQPIASRAEVSRIVDALNQGRRVEGRCLGTGAIPATTAYAPITIDFPTGEALYTCPVIDVPGNFSWRMDPGQGPVLNLSFVEKLTLSEGRGPSSLAVTPPIDQFRFVDRQEEFDIQPQVETVQADGRRVKNYVIPFAGEPFRSIKYRTTGALQINFLANGRDACVRPVSIPAHDGGRPASFEVIQNSWALNGKAGENLTLSFRVYHDSPYSLNRVGQIRLVDRNPGIPAQDVDFRVGGADSFLATEGGTIAQTTAPLMMPGQDASVEITINLTGADLVQDDLNDKQLQIIPQVADPSRTAPAIPIPLAPKTSVAMSELSWSTDGAALGARLRTQVPSRVARLLFADHPQPERRAAPVASLALPETANLARNDQQLIFAPISTEFFTTHAALFVQADIYVCAPRMAAGDKPCDQWVRLPAMPGGGIVAQPDGDGYDANGIIRTIVQNIGDYPNVVTALSIAGSEKTNSVPLSEPAFLAPGATENIAQSVADNEIQQTLLADIRSVITPVMMLPAQLNVPEPTVADRPQITVVNGELHRPDILVRDVFPVVFGWVGLGDRMPDVSAPLYTAEISLSRSVGRFEGIGLKVGMVNSEGDFISSLSSTSNVDELLQGGGRNYTIPLAISAEASQFSGSPAIKVVLVNEGPASKDGLSEYIGSVEAFNNDFRLEDFVSLSVLASFFATIFAVIMYKANILNISNPFIFHIAKKASYFVFLILFLFFVWVFTIGDFEYIGLYGLMAAVLSVLGFPGVSSFLVFLKVEVFNNGRSRSVYDHDIVNMNKMG